MQPPPPIGSPAVGTVLINAISYFGAVFAAGVMLGVARTLWLAPALGDMAAVALELPLMLGLSTLVARRLLRRRPMTLQQAALMGGVAFALLMAAETCLSIGSAGRGLVQHLALYREPAHQLGLAGQLAFAALPAWLARR